MRLPESAGAHLESFSATELNGQFKIYGLFGKYHSMDVVAML
ncbi:hypothetical protein ADINL_1478 [Nitrincola lacisaponensis]|uniref:Uncharacterized protein n=1 Tax=Nitrincola lacisaponensis TaxID=267850 RepID=A0A063Y4Z8_9GAMM|nr:hypothetical protein ADINL_1478 [Nitrincola lacisaponensis]